MKKPIVLTLLENMTKFQTGDIPGEGGVDSLFLLRAGIDHSIFLGKELWITFYDIHVLTVMVSLVNQAVQSINWQLYHYFPFPSC